MTPEKKTIYLIDGKIAEREAKQNKTGKKSSRGAFPVYFPVIPNRNVSHRTENTATLQNPIVVPPTCPADAGYHPDQRTPK